MSDRAEARADTLVALERDQEPSFHAAGEGRYRLLVPASGVVVEADYLRRDSHQLKAEVLVRAEIPGAKTIDGVLSVTDLNLSSARSRSAHAKHLAARARTNPDDLDWETLLEDFAYRVIAAERTGDPAVMLHEVPEAAPDETLDVLGWPLLARNPTILFGDGATSKSYLALFAGGTLAQRGHRVMFADWEMDGAEHRRRLALLFGDEMPLIAYARCARPLVHEADRLRRLVREHRIDYLVLDSIAFACDGPPEAAEVAGRFFQALRSLGPVGSLLLAHITKALEGADRRPFGSTFWHNGARATWNIKMAEAAPDDTTAAVALHNRKVNVGPLRPSVGLELHFGDRTTIRRIDLADSPDLAAGLSLRQRMALSLRRGAMSPEALAEEIDAKADSVRRTARRYRQQFTLLQGGKLSLLERQR